MDEYEVFCRELTGLVAERLAGQPVTRETLISAFRGALDALSPPDDRMAAEPASDVKLAPDDQPDRDAVEILDGAPPLGSSVIEMPSDIAQILRWFASTTDAKKSSPWTRALPLALQPQLRARAGSRVFVVQYYREIAVTQIERPIYFASARCNR